MTDKEIAREYALGRQKWLHLSQRDTNLIELAYLHGLEKGKDMGWHNLRSDPCNLPPLNITVLNEESDKVVYVGEGKWEMYSEYYERFVETDTPIAWHENISYECDEV